MTTSTPYQMIDTPEALAELCSQLRGVPWLALDTEFMRERTYRPQLCLVQLKHKDTLALIDTIALDDLSPLLELLADKATVKVLHAGSQDLEIFYYLMKAVPGPVFDTQVAAPLLGYQEQFGYGNLVREHLGIELSKSHTRADWSKRPLSDGERQYALDDVIHLETLYLDMREKLEINGRLAWLDDEFDALLEPEKYLQPAGERWQRIRQIDRYKGPALSIIQALAEWREIKAREINQPRNWLMKDDVIVHLARQAPTDQDGLTRVRGLDKRTLAKHGETLLALIRDASSTPPKALPKRARKKKLSAPDRARMQLLKAWAQQRAVDVDIAASLLLPDKLLEDLCRDNNMDALSGWRRKLLVDDLDALLMGRRGLIATDSGLDIVDFAPLT